VKHFVSAGDLTRDAALGIFRLAADLQHMLAARDGRDERVLPECAEGQGETLQPIVVDVLVGEGEHLMLEPGGAHLRDLVGNRGDALRVRVLVPLETIDRLRKLHKRLACGSLNQFSTVDCYHRCLS